ncbi:MAG: lytic transglycosylase domain-containing protein [Magnetococcales bacterium]|nr:lytic transglycosylase domain-containing protein [Magnetococcales bacterium]
MRRRHIITVGATLWVLSFPFSASCAVYSYVDERGIVHLTDRPTDPRYRLLSAAGKGKRGGKKSVSTLGVADPFHSVISDAARRHGVQSALIKAVIKAESGFNPMAVSRKGAVGLMQLMPGTAKRYGVLNRLDPVANINGGAKMLRELLTLYDNNLRLSLAAYNAGSSAVKKYGNDVPPYPETRRYISKVLKFYRTYKKSM